jgi:hypothetical protein
MSKNTTKSLHPTSIENLLSENTKEIHLHTIQVKKQNSLVQSLLRGLFTALGATIGLSLVLGLFTIVLAALVQTPIIGDLVKWVQILIDQG